MFENAVLCFLLITENSLSCQSLKVPMLLARYLYAGVMPVVFFDSFVACLLADHILEYIKK